MTYGSLKEAVDSNAEVLVLAMGQDRTSIPDDLVQKLKKKKVIGIGYGAARIFGQLQLEISGGACAHFGNNVSGITLNKDSLLLRTLVAKTVVPYSKPLPSDNFGMFVPPQGGKVIYVDVIARFKNHPNYAPIVRQNNYVMIGLSAAPQSWSNDYRAIVSDVASAMLKREKEPFKTAGFPILQPGNYGFALGRGRSKENAFSTTYYFKFTKPTHFTAKLEQTESKQIMFFFRGGINNLHWTRKDAVDGRALTIECEISADDLKRIGDDYWTLSVTNFDPINVSTGVVSVQYENVPNGQEVRE